MMLEPHHRSAKRSATGTNDNESARSEDAAMIGRGRQRPQADQTRMG
jgi:hypothetical protein